MRIGFAALLAFPLSAFASALTITGSITLDSKPVASAAISVRSGHTTVATRTDAAGSFAVALPDDSEVTLVVPPVCIEERCVPRTERHFRSSDVPIRIELTSASINEEIVVTAARVATRLDDSAKSVVVLSADEIRHSAGRSADDLLRQVPGFALFRRSSSAAANPTAQGASLRGVGGSGASRTLVLLDGVPLNDPFGGWIAWGMVSREDLGRVEVLRGGGSDLFGSGAFGGVINMLTVPRAGAVHAEASGGTLGAADGWAAVSSASDAGSARLSLGAMNYDGYFAVPDSGRGSVDRRVSSRHALVEATASRRVRPEAILSGRVAWFSEDRGNGTQLQTNETRSTLARAGATFAIRGISFDTRIYASDQTYNQTFSAVSTDHDSERLTRLQTVPSSSVGFSAQASRAFEHHLIVSGFDARQVNGWSSEATGEGFAGRAGGRQRTFGVFIEDLLQVAPSLSLSAALRYDRWENFDASRQTPAEVVPLPDRRDGAFSPRLSLTWHATDRLNLSASSYRAFRAPTLNELYRSFRLGNVVTFANDSLAAERLEGIELGGLTRFTRDLSARMTLYQMSVDDSIVNVTRSTTPAVTTRQRDNVGRTRSRGIELDIDGTVRGGFSITAGYLYVQPIVASFDADPTLEGMDLPQVPRQQVTIQLRRSGSIGTAAFQGRWTAAQFDDDRNQLRLASYASMDLYAAHPFAAGIEAFAAIENLFNQRAEVGRTPNLTLGPPRSLTIGIRYR